jgi:hypothetical protein
MKQLIMQKLSLLKMTLYNLNIIQKQQQQQQQKQKKNKYTHRFLNQKISISLSGVPLPHHPYHIVDQSP